MLRTPATPKTTWDGCRAWPPFRRRHRGTPSGALPRGERPRPVLPSVRGLLERRPGSPMTRRVDLPGAARVYIFAMVAAGVAAIAFRLPDVAKWNHSDTIAFAGLVVANVFIEQFMVRIPHRTETLNIALEEALWIGGLMLARPSTLTLAIAAGTLVGQGVRRWSVYKVAFNISQFLVAITCAEFAFRALHPASSTQPAAWGAAAIAMLGYFAVNAVTVALVISLAERRSFLSVLLPPLHLNLMHWAGNTALGIL